MSSVAEYHVVSGHLRVYRRAGLVREIELNRRLRPNPGDTIDGGTSRGSVQNPVPHVGRTPTPPNVPLPPSSPRSSQQITRLTIEQIEFARIEPDAGW